MKSLSAKSAHKKIFKTGYTPYVSLQVPSLSESFRTVRTSDIGCLANPVGFQMPQQVMTKE